MTIETGSMLVVDDDKMSRMLLTRNLQQVGHTVVMAESGAQALDLLRSHSVDIILLDCMMPEMDGYQVLEKIMGDETLRQTPVIMVSADNEMASVVTCIEMGAEDYLHKPFDPSLLRARISNSLEKKRSREREQRLFEQLQEKHRHLQELEKLRNDLTHMIVHDLRTPLTSILTGLQTMEMMGGLDESHLELLNMGIQGGEALLGMINDLLDISKTEDGSIQMKYEDLNVEDVVKQAVRQVTELAREKSLALKTEMTSGLPGIRADEDKLRRTLVNLLGNAIKFSPEESTITLSVKQQSPSLVFSVSDKGEGIPKEYFERIFEKFGQVETRKSGQKMSTGLGLTFCKMAVEAHGGKIWLESETGKGSTFFFTIPFQRS